MGIVLGVDIGSSTTKVVAMNEKKELLATLRVSASDQVTSLFGAISRMIYEQKIHTDEIQSLILTGVGASFVKGDIYDLATKRVTEFDALAKGGLYLSGLKSGVIGSIGTGTVFVYTDGKTTTHLGGSAVGGGTLVGLSSRLFGIRDVKIISDMAAKGDLRNVDWGISEVSSQEMESLPDYATASNFGKMKSTATDEDVAAGLFNMIFQTAGTIAVLACQKKGIEEAVITGSLSTLEHAKIMLDRVGELYHMHFIIPEKAAFATAIGAALLGLEENEKLDH